MTTGTLAVCGATVLAGVTAAVLRGVHAPSSQLLAPSFCRVPNATGQIALTFDDGPSESTPELLQLLARYGVHATFFLCGKNVERLPDVARAIVAAGHEIGNHTHRHIRMCPRLGWKLNLLSPADILADMQEAQVAIHKHTGVWPRYFRAPYGLRWFGLRAAQRKLGLTGVLWTVIGHDWEWSRDRIADHVLRQARPGGIVCLHDGRDIRVEADLSEMLAALDTILPVWQARGYCIGTVSELVEAGRRRLRVMAPGTPALDTGA